MSQETENITEKLKAANADQRLLLFRTIVEEFVKKILGLKKDEPINFNATFLDLGLDSVSAVQLKKKINEACEGYVGIETTDIFDHPTINKLGEFLNSVKNIYIEPQKGTRSVVKETEDLNSMSKKDVFKELDSFLDDKT